MKRIVHKLGSRKGETLVEILVAVLIVVLAATIFGSLYAASMSINMSARKQDEEFYKAVEKLEEMMNDGPTGGSSGTLGYDPTGENEGSAGVDTKGAQVQFYTEDGVTVYYGGE